MEQLEERLKQIQAGDKGTVGVMVASQGEYVEKTLDITFGKRQ